MNVTVTRTAVIFAATILLFAGVWILWQQINQPSPDGCYFFPFGMGAMMSAYQGSCPYDSLPNYYASDLAWTLIGTAFLLNLISVRGKQKVTLG